MSLEVMQSTASPPPKKLYISIFDLHRSYVEVRNVEHSTSLFFERNKLFSNYRQLFFYYLEPRTATSKHNVHFIFPNLLH